MFSQWKYGKSLTACALEFKENKLASNSIHCKSINDLVCLNIQFLGGLSIVNSTTFQLLLCKQRLWNVSPDKFHERLIPFVV